VTQGSAAVSNLKNVSVTLNAGQATTVLPPDTANDQPPPSPPGPPPPGFSDAVRKMTITVRKNDPISTVQPGAGPAAGATGTGGAGGDGGAGGFGSGGPAGSGVNASPPPSPAAPSNSPNGLLRSPLLVPTIDTAQAPPSTTPVTPPVVSPVATSTVVGLPAPPTRIGTQSRGSVVITRDDAPGALHGSASGVASPFSLIGPDGRPVGSATFTVDANGRVVLDYSFAPQERGVVQGPVTLALQDDASAAQLALGSAVTSFNPGDTVTGALLQGEGVGPVFASSVGGGGLAFGSLAGGTRQTLELNLFNLSDDLGVSADPEIYRELTGLSLLGIAITGQWKDLFSIGGDIPDFLLPGEVARLLITYDAPLDPGFFDDATLTIVTDEGAAFGQPGHVFTFRLSGGTVIPEPATLALLVPALAAGLGFRRRRQSGPSVAASRVAQARPNSVGGSDGARSCTGPSPSRRAVTRLP
jgi:hypothetical protein